MPVGHDAQRARRLIVESKLARTLHVEAALGVLVVRVDLLEIALQIGKAVEIGVDALYGGVLLLADQGRWAMRRFHGSVPPSTFVAGALIDLARCNSGCRRIRFRGIVGWFILRGDRACGWRRFLHCRAVLGEHDSGRIAK